MGTNESLTRGPESRTKVQMPMSCLRMSGERGALSLPNLNSVWSKVCADSLLETMYTGKWVKHETTGQIPSPRINQFTVYSEDKNFAIIGFGADINGTELGDVWKLDISKLTWEEIKLTEEISPRLCPSATINGDIIYIFGGKKGLDFFDDLYQIDFITGEVHIINTTGDAPTPRYGSILQYFQGKLILWGGYDGSFPTEIYVLDLSTNVWTSTNPKVSGRANTPWVVSDDKILSYGGSKGGEMLIIDMTNLNISICPCVGTPPPSEVTGAQMLLIERYLFYFGGKASTDWTFIYACDLTKMYWFVFDMEPDGKTVQLKDGHVSDIGMFMLPRLHSYGCCYSKKYKSIFAFCGYPMEEPMPINIIYIGEALSVMHVIDDMIEVRKSTADIQESKTPFVPRSLPRNPMSKVTFNNVIV